MSSDPDPGRRRVPTNGLAFFGAVTASVSHELNNVISIIDQTAGLLQDMIAGEQQGIPIGIERLTEMAASVRNQTSRGLGIIRRLNRFAHGTDHPVSEFDLNEVAENLVQLTGRLADLKRTRLDFKPYPMTLTVTGSPFLLQQAAFGILLVLLNASERDDAIEIAVSGDDSHAALTIRSPRPVPADDDIAKLRALVVSMHGELAGHDEGGSSVYCITIPARPPVTDETEK